MNQIVDNNREAAETMLFIDDEVNILTSLVRLFRPLGYRILTAQGGAEALALMQNEAVDLVICDMRMPDMSGAEVLEQIRKRWPNVVRLLLTGYSDIEDTIVAINRGEIHRYISKPWDDNEIVLVVRDALERKRLLAEKLRLEALTQKQNEEIKQLYDQVVAEQEVSERLLLNVLPAAIVERLKGQGSIPANGYKVKQGSFIPLIADSFADVTVLFADIVDFTKFASNVDPKKLVVVLNEIFTIFDVIAENCELEKIKTIGDAYMAVAGVPSLVEGHATKTAQMALDMIDALHAFNKRNGYALQMRVGINSGAVVAGVIGKHKFIYDLWGETVNIASRMESHGISGRIQITDATRQKLDQTFHCEERGVIEVKGMRNFKTWFLTGRG